ncbi:MAG: YihY/virulence factor BrkB family protein [Chloroflexota bacterium]
MNEVLNLKSITAMIRAQPPVQYVIKRWQRLPLSTRALPGHLWQAIMNFKNYGMKQAAALAYYAVFSVFPMTLLLAVGISSVLGQTVALEQIYQGLNLFLPEETGTITLFQESLDQALDQGTSFGVLALVGLTWSALGLFSNLTSSLDRIFQVPASRSIWTERLLAFVMTLGLIGLVVTSFITSGVLSLADALLLSNPSVWIRIGTLFLPFGLNMVIFVLLFRYVPSRHVSWDAVWPAAILGAVALEAAKQLFAWYLSGLANYQIVYGSIATVIILMVWAYLTASIFLICAEICSQVNLWLLKKDEQEQRVSVFIDADLAALPDEIPPPM